jgi:hypothetical protein
MHLVPEPRVDKNQRIVTRYVRPFDDQPHKALRIAPTAQIFTDQGEALSQSIGTRLDSEFMLEKGIRVSEVMKAARRLPPEVADALRLVLADSSSNCFPHLLASALHNGESPDTLDNIALLFSEYQYQEYEWGATGAGEYETIMRDIRGLQHMERFGDIANLNRAERETRQVAIAMNKMFELAERGGRMRVATTVDGEEYSSFTDDRMAGMVLDNMDRIGVVIDAAYEYDADVDMMLKKVNTTAGLRDGVL